MPTECLRLLFSNYGILVSTFEAPRLTVTDWIEKNLCDWIYYVYWFAAG